MPALSSTWMSIMRLLQKQQNNVSMKLLKKIAFGLRPRNTRSAHIYLTNSFSGLPMKGFAYYYSSLPFISNKGNNSDASYSLKQRLNSLFIPTRKTSTLHYQHIIF